ncbi:hypothetical protein Vretifemale_12385, partial [Volvox reticuliferus]
STLANRAHIHEINATLDNKNAPSDVILDRKISLIGSVTPYSRVDLTDYKLSVYGGPWVETDTLRVHLCRYEATPLECPELRTLEQFPPPSPPPPSPPPRSPTKPRMPPKPPVPRPPPKPPAVSQQGSPPPQARSSPPVQSPSPRPPPPSPRARRAAGRRRPA